MKTGQLSQAYQTWNLVPIPITKPFHFFLSILGELNFALNAKKDLLLSNATPGIAAKPVHTKRTSDKNLGIGTKKAGVASSEQPEIQKGSEPSENVAHDLPRAPNRIDDMRLHTAPQTDRIASE